MKRPLLAPILCLGLCLGLTACTGGERNQTGECPADEACSPLTPYGLHFTGQELVGVPLLSQPKITSIDGTQTIRLYLGESGGGAGAPINLPFAAMADNGDALAIAGTGATSVILRGIGTGRDLLRITEATTDLLFDRYEVEAAVLDHIVLVPGTFETYVTAQPIGFYRGEVAIGLALYSASNQRVVDDSMTLDAGPGAPMTRDAWDTFTFGNLQAGIHSPVLTAAGRPGAIDLEVVDAITAVLPLDDSFPATIHPGDQGSVCFHAQGGSRESIMGLPWQFSTTGAVTPVIGLFANCYAIQVNAPGTFTVTATALGVMATVAFDAVAAAAAPTSPRPADAPARFAPDTETRGERAQLTGP